ncbi:ATP/GTP-binding protein [Streptomyces sp. bgisy082]|uniref:ATP/GTP-binding protein n=1 Tax=Streptomyces sp. bgisy082 TaxID=3413776 RepID=UPI003D745CB0
MGRDLRALFSSNDRGVSTAEAFTNRQAQWELVAAALTEHLERVSSPAFDVEDLEAPRDNVLVFHGIGGIGKTTLSRKLEAALAGAEGRPVQWGEPSWPGTARIWPVRIDLARSAGTGFEQLVLTIRASLVGLGRPLPAFDLALRRYWEARYPGEPLEEYLQRGGLAARFGKALPQQMQSALSDVAQALLLPGTVGSAVGQVTGSLVRALRERRQTVRALAGCFRLADLLEAEPDLDALSFYPHLLAWELHQLPQEKKVTPVILLDTFEDVGDRTHRDLERLIQRVVWLMPNAFFVITGRSRLQWADPALQGQLDYTGPAAWPGLALSSRPPAVPHARTFLPGTPPARIRQALVGDFAPEDCDDYLARRLETDGTPLIPAPVRQVITAGSHGLPLYLDLSVMRFLELRRTGHTPEPADFEHDFGALIARTLADLTPDERHLLRSVSLLDAFDTDLATRAAGLTHQAAARRLVERPFVDENPFALWPYSLHGLIRSTLRGADDATDDRWTPTDWETAAVRALAALGEQWSSGPERDRLLLTGCLRQGLALARDFRLELGWLTDAAWAYVSDSVWEPVAPPARDGNGDGDGTGFGVESAAEALTELLSTLARRQHEHRSVTADRLTPLTHAGLLPDELQEMAVYYLAKVQRDLGRPAESRRGMQYVADGGGRLAPPARRGLAHLARLAGDFPTAHALVPSLGWPGRHHRVDGDIWWPHGDMHRAATAYEAARTEAEQHGVAGERATCQAQRVLALAFTDPRLADDELDLAEQLLTELDLRATTLTTRIAALIRDAGTDTDVPGRAEVLRVEIRTTGLLAPEALLDLALAFHHAVRDDAFGSVAVAELLEQREGGDHAYYADLAAFMTGRPAPSTTVRWIEDEETVRYRWHELVAARRALVRL